jgi:prepilin-type N-terminal cleavage/methylation domain-containing protein
MRGCAALREEPEAGFTLFEILIVLVIVGILAAIALPAFLGIGESGYDADAKSKANTVYQQVLSCHVQEEDFSSCDTVGELGGSAGRIEGIPWGSGAGDVLVHDAARGETTVTATSDAESGGFHHTFSIVVGPSGADHVCFTGVAPSTKGGCHGGSW